MKKVSSKNLTFSIVIEKDKNGYIAECRELQGCYTQGVSYEEVMIHMKEVIALHLEDHIDRGDLSVDNFGQGNISLTTLSFALPFRYVAKTKAIYR